MEAAGQKLRLVLHVTADGTGYKASLDSVDQDAYGMPMDAIRIDAAHLHFEMSQIRAKSDGDRKAGTMQFDGQ